MENKKTIFNHLISQSCENNAFPGAVMCYGQSEIYYQECYGYTCFNKKQPMSGELLFDIASITKAVTHIIIHYLIEKDIISPYDLLIPLLGKKFFRASWKDVTVKDLLEEMVFLEQPRTSILVHENKITESKKLLEAIALQSIEYKQHYTNATSIILFEIVKKFKDQLDFLQYEYPHTWNLYNSFYHYDTIRKYKKDVIQKMPDGHYVFDPTARAIQEPIGSAGILANTYDVFLFSQEVVHFIHENPNSFLCESNYAGFKKINESVLQGKNGNDYIIWESFIGGLMVANIRTVESLVLLSHTRAFPESFGIAFKSLKCDLLKEFIQ